MIQKHKKLKARILSLVLTAAMVGTMMPATVLAAEGETSPKAPSNLECHLVHDENCGYKEAVAGADCSHKNEDGTYSCSDTVSGNTATPSNGEQTVCTHEDGCGYKEATQDAPCKHTCEKCAVKDSSEADKQPVQEQCSCDVRCTESNINANCAICAAAGADLTACTAADEPAALKAENRAAAVPAPNAAGSRYESITIARDSLNGNTIWGVTEDYNNPSIMLDDSAFFYAEVSDRNDGKGGGLPTNGKLTTKDGVPYQFASGSDQATAYDGNDAIHLTTNHSSQSMTLQTIGAYEKIYVLATAGGPGANHYAQFEVTLTYTDGEKSETTYQLYDWFDPRDVPNVEKVWNFYRKHNDDQGGGYHQASNGPIMHSATIEANPAKLLKSIEFKMLGKGFNDTVDPNTKGLYCGIFAVTGAVSDKAPTPPTVLPATNVSSESGTLSFTANWTKVNNADGYRLDVSTDEDFTKIVSTYNNLEVVGGDTVSHQVTGLTAGTTYYYRVRAVSGEGASLGQSLASTRVATDVPQWARDTGLDSPNATYDVENKTLKLTTDVILKKPIVIPDGVTIKLDLNGKTLTAADGKPAIQTNGKVDLTVTDSTKPTTNPTISGGAGQPAIDFSAATPGSKVTLSDGASVQGGNGSAGDGGDGIKGNANTTVVVDTGSTATGGTGGAGGGNGGNGVTGGTVTINGDAIGGTGGAGSGDVTGGNGGNGVTGGNGGTVTINGNATGGTGGKNTTGTGGKGGTGASGTNISGNGAAAGGNGGDGSTPGAGGNGINGSGDVSTNKPGVAGSSKEEITIGGLSAPTTPKKYDGTAITNSAFGTATFDPDWPGSGTLEYTYYSVVGGTETPLGSAPKDAGTYKVKIAIPATDATSTGETTVSFTIAPQSVTVTDGGLSITKTYDGTTGAGITTGALGLTGVLNNDDVSVKIDKVGAYADANVGNDQTVTLTISLDGSAKGNYTLGSATYSFTKAKITKGAYPGIQAEKPDALKATRTHDSITLNKQTIDGETVEYGYSADNSATGPAIWQNSPTFSGLDSNTEYFFFARVKETTNHEAGTISTKTTIKTANEAHTGNQAAAPDASKAIRTHDTITLNTQTITGETVEYGIKNPDGTIKWQDSPTFSGLDSNTEYFFYARVTESATHAAGTTSDATKIKTEKVRVDVSGIIKNSDDLVVSDAAVKLMQGGIEVKNTTTDSNGAYKFTDVLEGVYSIVVTTGTGDDQITITETVTVAGKPITGAEIKLPAGKKNTVVKTMLDTPPTAAKGLNELFELGNVGSNTEDAKGITTNDLDTVTDGGSVTVTLTSTQKTEAEVQADAAEIEKVAAAGEELLLLDFTVTKVVQTSTGAIKPPITMKELPSVVEIVVKIPEALRSAASIRVYRVHEGVTTTLGNTAVKGEYAERKGDYMHVFAKYFSTYALGYVAYDVTIAGGGTGASGAGNYPAGAPVTINAGSKSGYSFNGWTVTAGTVTLADSSSATTTFTMPAQAVTVTAGWTSTGGGGGGGGSTGGGSGSSSDTYYSIEATAGPGGSMSTAERVQVRAGESASFTITPDKGYQIEDVLVNGKSIGAKNTYVFTKVYANQTIHATFKKVGSNNPQTVVSFSDVKENDWCYDAMMKAMANGWFSGTSATTFSPNAPTTRGMVATILHRMEGIPKANATSFNDVETDVYYTNGVAWGEANSIVRGYGNGNYGPNDNITREQLVAILYRYASHKGYDVSKKATLDSFTDSKRVSGYAKEAMSWAVGSGLISGRGNNTLAPTATAIRAEVAVILLRFDELFIK